MTEELERICEEIGRIGNRRDELERRRKELRERIVAKMAAGGSQENVDRRKASFDIVIDAIRKLGGKAKPKKIGAEVGRPSAAVSKTLAKAIKCGALVKNRPGWYEIPL